ncbi:MAG: hypothetical protein RL213_172 [Bacteroidota bacterium]|jgi:hypothetical protein
MIVNNFHSKQMHWPKVAILISTALLLLTASSGVFAQSNYIQGGTAGPGDTLTDLDPDSVLQCISAHLNPYQSTRDTFDLDRDGRPDIYFFTYGDAGLGGGTAGCRIQSAGAHAQIAVRVDTALVCCPQYVPIAVADTFSAGDTIGAGLDYDTTGWIMSESWGGSLAPNFDKWNNIGPAYIGVRLILSTDTLYAWIRVEAVQAAPLSLFTLTVFDFASNKNLHIGWQEGTWTETEVFPTVSKDYFRLKVSRLPQAARYRVYDLKGAIMEEGSVERLTTVLDATRWANGTYVLSLTDGDFSRSFKLIKE